jgi:hypothetical protein
MGGDRIIEMTWRCSACKRQNLGRYKQCQGCGNPKDASEPFEMPANTESAPTVTDPDLLRMATAGPDWRCRFCGSDQRRSDDSCANCGASAAGGSQADIRPAVQAPRRKTLSNFLFLLFFLFTCSCGGCFTCVAWVGRTINGDRAYTATVQSATWEHVIDVERYALRTHEGFEETIPADAIDVKRIGRRVHHHDKVQTGWENQSFVDTVPDGTRLERYTVRETCGEDCTTTPRRCREVCKSNSNGFATCREVCSGGDRKCKPRYCSETRTREVAQTRSEVRTIRVPTYRDEPRYADAFSYKAWSWEHDRTARERGAIGEAVERGVAKLPWPAGARTSGLSAGEQEREKRTARYIVTLRYSGDSTLRFEVKSPDALARFTPGSEHALRIESGAYTVANAGVVTPLNAP